MVLISTNNQYLCLVLSLELSLMHVFCGDSVNPPYIINKVNPILKVTPAQPTDKFNLIHNGRKKHFVSRSV